MRGWSGLTLAATAYVLWGASALYWPLLRPAGATEIVAIRVVLSFAALAVLVTVLRRWAGVRVLARDARQWRLLTAAAALIAVNWGVFIYATTHDQVIEASLGYFVSPLVIVALGVLVFRERPRRRQWLAVGLGTAGVGVLVTAYGRLPWIAVTLAVTFGLYAVVKKRSGARAVESLTVETAVLLPPALAYAVALQAGGSATFGHVSGVHTGLMVGASLVMLVPLLLFAAAANQISLISMGLLQYVEPVVQFLLGLVVFSESMPGPRWVAFGLVWAAILVLVTGRPAAATARAAVSSAGPRP
jgi:chloramphenicol-sensitive protein RarD